MNTALMKHGTVSWTVEHKASEYQWSVHVGDDTAEGTCAAESDALREVAEGVNKLRTADNAVILITHYQRLLDYIRPDFVHVLAGGRIVRSGDKTLATELEKKGYEHIGA
jgi:Fe-S cluster assembly ATP-binding protein